MRERALERLRAQQAGGNAIVGAGAGTGLSAKCAEAGGVDLIIIYNSGRYRMSGRGSLAGLMPFGDANAIVVEMAAEVLPVVKDTPVLAGVCGTDPFRLMPVFLRQLKDIGFAGVQNFPTVGLIDGTFRQNLEETGMGYGLEIEMIREAHDLDLLTTPYVFSPDDARGMATAGADVLVAHMGLTAERSAPRRPEPSTTASSSSRRSATRRSRSTPTSSSSVTVDRSPNPTTYVLERTKGVARFFGASSIERLPTEVAMTETARRFKSIRPSPAAERSAKHAMTSIAVSAALRAASASVPWKWDLASLPEEAVEVFPHADSDSSPSFGRLNSARVATWCWARSEFEELRWHAEHHMERVRRAQSRTNGT